jgi:membrane-bound lytic murein transglycosylase B
MQARALLWLALGVSLIILGILAALVLLAPRVAQQQPDGLPPASWGPPAAAPVLAAAPAGFATLADADWIASTSQATGIPQRALAAYAAAAIARNQADPGCNLSWNTLAAIGWAESRHGTHGGSSIQPDGSTVPAIIGVPLDGGDTDVVTDSDDGAIDGDAVHDRAVGPMQLIPQTWRSWHNDASGDGVEDPQNIDDAVTATAHYLCRSGADMATEAGWRTAITSYNNATTYITKVAEAATRYAE